MYIYIYIYILSSRARKPQREREQDPADVTDAVERVHAVLDALQAAALSVSCRKLDVGETVLLTRLIEEQVCSR